MFTNLAWLVLYLLFFLAFLNLLLGWFSSLKIASTPTPLPKTRVEPPLKPRSPHDCPLCRAQITPKSESEEVRPVPPAWAATKSKRGRPKLMATAGYACPNPGCLYFAISDPNLHALVGDGCHGKNERIQTFRCQSCKKTFTSRCHTILYRLKTPANAVGQVLTALAYGLDTSAASVIFGYHPLTIASWLCRAGHHSQNLHGRFLHRLHLPYLQLDELRTRLRNRNQVIWLWTAIDPTTKLLPVLYLGERNQVAAHTLIHWLLQTLAPRWVPLFTSDGLNLYF